ncbi:hypothetical protein ES705_49078 [subsurface metagenome]
MEEASVIVKGCNVNEVAIIHVHERYDPLPTIPNESIKWIMQEHKKEGEKILSEALKFIKGKNIKARTILKEGHPADTIVSIAHEERFDMIVIGSRGLGGFTKNMVTWTGAKMIGTAFVKLAGILDTDIINTCTYKYETNNGYEEMPYLTLDVQRSSINDETKIENAINGITQAFNDKDWDKVRSYCVYGSVAYNEMNELEQYYYDDPSNVADHSVIHYISPININGQYAEAYAYFTTVFISNGEVEEITAGQWHYLQKMVMQLCLESLFK